MLKTTIVTKPFIVVWIPNSLVIDSYSRKVFEKRLSCGLYENEEYQLKEFDTFEEADEFVDELWKIWGGNVQLKDIKTLAEISKENNISVETLRYRLKFLDSKDYRKMDKGTLLTPKGVEEILKERG